MCKGVLPTQYSTLQPSNFRKQLQGYCSLVRGLFEICSTVSDNHKKGLIRIFHLKNYILLLTSLASEVTEVIWGQWRSFEVSKCYLRPVKVNKGDLRPLEVTWGHWRSLEAIGGHLRLLVVPEATGGHWRSFEPLQANWGYSRPL